MLQQHKIRKEVSLDNQTLALLQIQAEKEGRKLKNYLEDILKQKANEFELSDEYKTLMDERLDKHEKGEINYTSWDQFKKSL
ncbi:hypothetical protein [Apibacter adventoris]|uniref:Toxin-antitoxin system, antitoxin component, ribbon-helix-helix domain protein n=1 Tax=Apibacter adventoris TaxID=1679466 RepID=A0A2S8AAW4_9FLAO|nr:hypothetical protein [Apibacter adventoris]PQL91673.1 hypothetical protein C4S77_07685 [Apibacter adventoris]